MATANSARQRARTPRRPRLERGRRRRSPSSRRRRAPRSDVRGAKAAARKRGASKGTGSGAGAMTVAELRREAARLGIEGRSRMGKAQLIRSVGHKRRSSG
jgi:hypothetical protein